MITGESSSEPDASGVLPAAIRVEGQLRDSGSPFAGRASLRLGCTDGEPTSIEVIGAEEDLARIAVGRAAQQRLLE